MNTEQVDPGDARTVALDYYDGPEVVDTLLDALMHAGLDPDALDIDDLATWTSSTRSAAQRHYPWPSSQARSRMTGSSMSVPGLAVRLASWRPATARTSQPSTRPLASAAPRNC
jgi:Tfp pilus assembly PilM family ATPase